MAKAAATQRRHPTRKCLVATMTAVCLTAMLSARPATTSAVDTVKFRTKESADPQTISGKLLVTARDGGLMLRTADGTIWNVPPDELIEHTADDTSFTPLAANELRKQLLKEYRSFDVVTTNHYIICYNTSKAYAQWCGSLYERLYAGFHQYWKNRGIKLTEPDGPMLAMVFSTPEAYAHYSEPEIGKAAGQIIGYYSFKTNRVAMYDLTGMEKLRRPGDKRSSPQEITQILARPDAESMVATIVHEATHQIAYNCGMHERFADIPLWVAEGLAEFFETPDLRSATGWKSAGGVNTMRLDRFRDYLPKRGAGSLQSLLVDDKRMREPRQALDAYAEAWAFNYFLLKRHGKQYNEYLQMLATKKAWFFGDAESRLKEFRTYFGDDLKELDDEFVRYARALR